MEQLYHSLETVEDDIVENMESFTLSLTTSEQQIMIPIDSIEVLINDNDGELVYTHTNVWDIDL